jgi:hypothetical protein
VPADLVHLEDTEDAVEYCYVQGWTDGLPVVPPTAARVRAMLQAHALDGDEVLAVLPEFDIPITADVLAANAVMAGARPEHLPYALAGLRAACDAAFNLPMATVTTGGAAIVLVISGPADTLAAAGFRWQQAVLGAGHRANVVVSRTVNLLLRNALNLAERDRATVGSPGRIACSVVESPFPGWTPLRVMRGFDEAAVAVTAFAGESPHQVANHFSTDPELVLATVADVMASCTLMTGAFVVVLCPEHTRKLVDHGWDHGRAAAFLAGRAQRSARHLKQWGRAPGRVYPEDETIMKRAVAGPEDVLIVPAGGAGGGFSAVIPPVGIDTLVAFRQLDPAVPPADDAVARRSSLPVSRPVQPCRELV